MVLFQAFVHIIFDFLEHAYNDYFTIIISSYFLHSFYNALGRNLFSQNITTLGSFMLFVFVLVSLWLGVASGMFGW